MLRQVGPDELTNATPCREFNVAQVVEHLAGSVVGIGGQAGAKLSPTLTDNPEIDIADLAQPALEAWAKRGLDGTVDVGVGDMPAANVVGILAVEFLVHGWDVAMATGQKLEVNDELAAYVLSLSKRVVEPDAARQGRVRPRDSARAGRQRPRPADRLHRPSRLATSPNLRVSTVCRGRNG